MFSVLQVAYENITRLYVILDTHTSIWPPQIVKYNCYLNNGFPYIKYPKVLLVPCKISFPGKKLIIVRRCLTKKTYFTLYYKVIFGGIYIVSEENKYMYMFPNIMSFSAYMLN